MPRVVLQSYPRSMYTAMVGILSILNVRFAMYPLSMYKAREGLQSYLDVYHKGRFAILVAYIDRGLIANLPWSWWYE